MEKSEKSLAKRRTTSARSSEAQGREANADQESITERMDLIIQLIAIGLADGKKQKDQIRLLAGAGLKPKRIAEILGTTPNTVNVAMSNLRREKLLRGKQNGKE